MVKKLVAAALVVASLAVAGCSSAKDDGKVTIGITQIVVHDALDAARKGFLDALKEGGYEEGKNLVIDYKNAQGDPQTAQSIAKDFVTNKVDMIFAIATPTAQAAYNSTKEIPIVITAVTDPVDAGIAKALDKSGTNVTGTSDDVPIGPQLDLIIKIIPSVKTLGVVYNTSEANSVLQVKRLKEAAAKVGLAVEEAGVTNVNEMNQVMPVLLSKVDALYIPTDNTVASAYALVNKLALEKKIPVFAAEDAGVTAGALLSAGIDYYQLGKEAGQKAIEVLKGKAPTDIAITTIANPTITINKATADALGITIPEDILKGAVIK